MEHPVPDFHPEPGPNAKKPGLPDGDRASIHATKGLETYDQPRVRERIMKLSKVYSATCHHRYWSER